jgi:hypothetical protein
MINHLDNLLRDLFKNRVTGITQDTQVRFQPPDDAWRNYVGNLQLEALNVYLVDVRDNRKLFSNERMLDFQNGLGIETPAPRRIDCHYLITAWSPVIDLNLEPTRDEHARLYEIAAVLMNFEPINPSRIYPPGSAQLNAIPLIIRDADLPTSVMPPEAFPKLAEFWGTMGTNHRWKPAIYLIVTLPVILNTQMAGIMVTTLHTTYNGEVFIQIGGHVQDVTVNPSRIVEGAWVRLEDAGGTELQTVFTDEEGHFTFGNLTDGNYTLRVRVPGFNEAVQPITVPSLSGSYDVSIN